MNLWLFFNTYLMNLVSYCAGWQRYWWILNEFENHPDLLNSKMAAQQLSSPDFHKREYVCIVS
jgi:hypothetical protein